MSDEITATVGGTLYSFDGRVLEIFGGHPVRFHIRHMHLRVTGPDRKGRQTVEIRHGRPEAPGASHVWTYTAAERDDLRALTPVLDAVQAAIDSASR
ncbi:hypothetical protein [Streptomyces sp. NPDC058583]|uniref:hypothetical protein n=1 Tax=unclassified Streptomyces TaxID=2593676 RepID=UPI00365B0F8D